MLTGNLTGSMTYSNYKDIENNECGIDEITMMVGTFNVTGLLDVKTGDLINITNCLLSFGVRLTIVL